MASPVGHALVGLASAAVASRITETPGSTALWVGAAVASVLPDLDLLTEVFGRRGPRFHRNATHSLVFIAAVVLPLAMVGIRFGVVDEGIMACWVVALISHPLLDVAVTGPTLAAQGYGIALLWPVSRRRFHVERPLGVSPDLSRCRSPRDLWHELRPELVTVGAAASAVLVAALLI